MFHHNTHHQHDAHAHKHHLPRLPLDDLPPRELASLTAFLIHHILNASAPVVTPVSPMSGSGLTRHSSSSTDTTADNHGHDHDHLVFAPSAQTALAHFLHSVFTVTKVSGAVVVLALKYLQRYARRLVGVDRVSVGESASGVFVSALILAVGGIASEWGAVCLPPVLPSISMRI